jgi:hypothetical protein
MAMYFAAKLLNIYSGVSDYSSSSSSDSSCDIISSTTMKSNQNKKILYPRITLYHTSNHTFNITDIAKLPNITDTTQSSVSYIGLIFTTQYGIEYKQERKIDNLLTEYEKIALLGFIKEQLYNQLISSSNTIHNTIPNNLIAPINCQVFKKHLGVFITVYKNNELRANIGTIETNNDEFTIESNLKRFAIKLGTTAKTRYRDIDLPPLEPSEFNKLTFNITILSNTKTISINDYFGNKFKFGNDCIIVTSTKYSKCNQYSLSSIEEKLGNISKNILLETLYDIDKKTYSLSDINLYSSEGLIIM